MPRWLKVLLVLGGAGIVLAGLAIGGFAWWLNANKGDLRAKGIEAEGKGREYARGRDSNACIDESLRRLGSASGIMEQALLGIFLKGCLLEAKRDPTLCTGVPQSSEIMKSVSWRTNACVAHGKSGDEACARLLGAIQEVCHPTVASAP